MALGDCTLRGGGVAALDLLAHKPQRVSIKYSFVFLITTMGEVLAGTAAAAPAQLPHCSAAAQVRVHRACSLLPLSLPR